MTSRIFTVPNQLTLLRLGFLPLFIILIFYRRYGWALAILVAAGLTDSMDGLLARTLNQKTSLGAYLDPIADKLLLSSSFVVLALEGQIRWWLTILVLGRDVLLLTTAAVILLTAGYRAFPPSIYGKLTTTLQIVLVFTVLAAAVFDWRLFHVSERILVYLVAGFTVFSGFHYSVVVARRLSHEGSDPGNRHRQGGS
jgi:cardiolipin synthase (CMP-forming)